MEVWVAIVVRRKTFAGLCFDPFVSDKILRNRGRPGILCKLVRTIFCRLGFGRRVRTNGRGSFAWFGYL